MKGHLARGGLLLLKSIARSLVTETDPIKASFFEMEFRPQNRFQRYFIEGFGGFIKVSGPDAIQLDG